MKKSILLNFELMKFQNTGLFHFDKSLGNALISQNNKNIDLTIYSDHKSLKYFNNQAIKLVSSLKTKLFFWKYKKYNLVHFTNQYCRLSFKYFSCPKVVTIHDLNQLHEPQIKTNKLKKHLRKLKKKIDTADRVVAISNFVATDIATFFPEAEKKIKVIYNGADKLNVKESHQPKYLPTKLFLFAIGFLSPKKNFHTLPALLIGNNYELIIAGIETSYKEIILNEAKKYDCLDRVTITGTITDDDKAWYYKNCSAFLFPSIAEGFGLPVIEAMYFGKPVFLSKYTSLPEIGGDAAFYFNSFDPNDMQATFTKGIETYKQESWKEKIMLHASKFNWDDTAKQYLALYKELMFE